MDPDIIMLSETNGKITASLAPEYNIVERLKDEVVTNDIYKITIH